MVHPHVVLVDADLAVDLHPGERDRHRVTHRGDGVGELVTEDVGLADAVEDDAAGELDAVVGRGGGVDDSRLGVIDSRWVRVHQKQLCPLGNLGGEVQRAVTVGVSPGQRILYSSSPVWTPNS